MRTKVTLVLIFLNVALFFFIFKFERHWRTEAASLEARRRVLGPETADIRTLQVTTTAGTGFSLQRRRDAWLLTQPFEWPANPHAVSAILHELQMLEHETSFPTRDLGKNNNPPLSDYGLDKPRLTLAFTSGDPAAGGSGLPTLLRIGDATKDGKRLYVLSPDGERVHIVSRSLADTLSLPPEQLRADELLSIKVFEATSLNLQTAADQARVRVRREGPRWAFDAPINARASTQAVELTINRLNSLKAKTFNPPAPAAAPSISPSLRISLEGNGRHETLFLGAPIAADKAADQEAEYYAQLENRAVLFTVVVPHGLIEVLRGATDKLRERRLLRAALAQVDFDPRAVTAITLAGAGASQPLTLQRLEAAANAAETGAWQMVRRSDGTAGPQTAPADRAAVERLLGLLASLGAEAFVSDNPSSAELEAWGFNRPEREITLALASAAPDAATSTLTLRLGTDAAGRVFAQVGSGPTANPSVYAVNVDLKAQLPLEPLAWRDRALPLVPANARIVALKLTDLANSAALLDLAFNADQQPVAAVRDPDALQALVGQLRSLRAREFRPEPFADRVVAGGDERPWRYQLDVSVVLPGSDQTATRTLFFAERTGGAEQLAGTREFDAIFTVEQPLLDALWRLTYEPGDPVPAPATPNSPPKG